MSAPQCKTAGRYHVQQFRHGAWRTITHYADQADAADNARWLIDGQRELPKDERREIRVHHAEVCQDCENEPPTLYLEGCAKHLCNDCANERGSDGWK